MSAPPVAPPALLRSLAETARDLTRRGELLPRLERLARTAAEQTGSSHVELVLADPLLRRFLGAGSARVGFEQPGDEAARRIREAGLPRAAPDLASEEETPAVLELRQRGVRAWAGAPVWSGDRAIGAILAFDREPRAFDAGEPELLAALGALAGQAIEAHRLADDLEEADRALRRLGMTDPATGVANEPHFRAIARREWERAVREGLPISVLLVAADGYATLRAENGPDGAERLLARIAQALRNGLYRTTDLVARLDGDRLAVLLPDTDARGARAIAGRLREEADLAVEPIGGAPTGISVGAASADTLPPEASTEPFERLLFDAAEALEEDREAREARG